jgi:hypothetical protein
LKLPAQDKNDGNLLFGANPSQLGCSGKSADEKRDKFFGEVLVVSVNARTSTIIILK